MRVRLEPGKRPIRARARRYAPAQRKFLDKYIDKLKEMDFVQDMPTAEWQAAPLLVAKPDSRAKFRLAVDLRPVNGATIKEAWPMPHLDSEISDFAGSACFASLDFVSGYWQLPLHPDSYTSCGIVTPKGVVASKRVLPGLANATAYFQSTVEPLFHSLRDSMKAWLDDFNLHAKEEVILLEKLETFFQICFEKNLFLHALKCVLFSKELKWCGRVVTKEGYRMDPARLDGLKDMHSPKNADELSEFVYCCRWMSSTIPDFAVRIDPLNTILEEAYSKSGKRTKRSIRNLPLSSLSWGPDQEKTFLNLQDSLRNAVTLSYPDPDKVVCVFTDASERFWSGVVTQTTKEQLASPPNEQKHEPLAFLGSAFRGAELDWTTFEKEGFAIFQTFEKMDYLFQCQPQTHLFTDHRNLLFVLAPLALEPSLGRHVVSKVQRWALFLCRFSYFIEHIKGNDNVFADILTRWTRGYRRERSERLAICSLLIEEADQLVPSPDDFDWPDLDAFRKSQQKSTQLTDGLVWDEDDKLWKKDNKIWIPSEDTELQLKVLVVSHCGVMGHRGRDATKSTLLEAFWWPRIGQAVEELVKGCLHCIITRRGEIVPRPLGHALHGSRPNEVIHVDFLYMGLGRDNKKYVLVIRDDLSSYVWLWPTESCTSEAAAEALCVWIGVFGSIDWLVSDQASHFKNHLVKALTDEMRVHHHFTTAYSPWANGSVERVCREVLRSCKALLSEWKLASQDWPAVTECVQSVLNHAPLQRLGLRDPKVPGVYRTPLEVFTGHIPVRPLLRALPVERHREARTMNEIHARQTIDITKTRNSLEEMHRDVHGLTTASRKRQVDRHNHRTNVHTANFGVGDFVLVRRAISGGHKLQFSWRGPRRVTAVKSDWVYEVQDLIQDKRELVHARRLRLYRAEMDGKEVTPKLLQAAAHSGTRYETAHALKSIRQKRDLIEVQVEWEGLPDDIDFTWEPLAQVFEDLPGLLEDFLHTAGERILKRRALEQCSLS